MNASPVVTIAINPKLNRYRDRYKNFFKGEGFTFATPCTTMLDDTLKENYVYFIHEDKSLTVLEVK